MLISLEAAEDPSTIIDYCFGMQFLTEVMDLEIGLEVDVLECDFGLFGFVIGDNQDCYWKKYPLEMPIAQIHFLNALDSAAPIVPYFCSYESYATDSDETKEGPSNEDRGYKDEFFATD